MLFLPATPCCKSDSMVDVVMHLHVCPVVCLHTVQPQLTSIKQLLNEHTLRHNVIDTYTHNTTNLTDIMHSNTNGGTHTQTHTHNSHNHVQIPT
jgi:hypothetical protein